MLSFKNGGAKSLALTGIIGALYFIITICFYPLSFGPIQVRFSEALTLLPLFFPEAVAGLTVGCFLSNLLGGNGALDIVFGTLATFLSALLTRLLATRIKNAFLKIIVGGAFPIILNAVIVPFTFLAVYELKELYFLSAFQVFLGQTISIYIIGALFILAIKNFANKKKV